jgi:hypothetical protein
VFAHKNIVKDETAFSKRLASKRRAAAANDDDVDADAADAAGGSGGSSDASSWSVEHWCADRTAQLHSSHQVSGSVVGRCILPIGTLLAAGNGGVGGGGDGGGGSCGSVSSGGGGGSAVDDLARAMWRALADGVARRGQTATAALLSSLPPPVHGSVPPHER